MNLSQYTLTDLNQGLSLLRRYRTLLRQVGNRGREIFARSRALQERYRIEYAPSMDIDTLHTYALTLLKKHFDITATADACEFIPQAKLSSGIRIFAEGDMVEVSFNTLEKQLRERV